MDRITVIFDAYGGDNAPLENLKGAQQAVQELDVNIILCGNEQELKQTAEKNGISLTGMEIVHTDKVIPVEAPPIEIRKEYIDSSMAVGMKLLAEGKGDAFVSAGSTGALTVGAATLVKRIKGIRRPAIGSMIPTSDSAYMLLDAGANAECRADMLLQFGIMGSAYMERLAGISNPRIGLVNIGTEETKGLDVHKQAYELLQASGLNFIGNIEARDLPLGGCDVAVCDGFVGNVVLKLTEGMGKMMANELKGMLMAQAKTKIAALLLKEQLNNFKMKLDYTEHGGAPLMGIAKPVIKAHGSSNAKAFKNAIRQAKLVCEKQVIPQIEDSISKLDESVKGEA